MRVGHRAKRGIAHRRDVGIHRGVLAELTDIVKSQRHDEIVRVLRVDEGQAVGGLAGLEEQGIAAIGDGGGLQAQHQLGLESAFAPALCSADAMK